jgi:large subunit ribosomal protein L4
VASVDVRTASGAKAGTAELADAVFGVQPNVPVMHQVVTAQLAARRAGTQSTKTRAEVRGGGAKPWKQKGTGRARQGSIRSPHWVGGGVSHAPKPRSYEQKTPKKMIRLALRGALSDRAADGKVVVLDGWGIEEPSTKAAIKLLAALDLADAKVLAVLHEDDEVVWKSFRNLGNVHCLLARELNAYDVLASDVVVFTKATLPTGEAAAPTTAAPTTAAPEPAEEDES